MHLLDIDKLMQQQDRLRLQDLDGHGELSPQIRRVASVWEHPVPAGQQNRIDHDLNPHAGDIARDILEKILPDDVMGQKLVTAIFQGDLVPVMANRCDFQILRLGAEDFILQTHFVPSHDDFLSNYLRKAPRNSSGYFKACTRLKGCAPDLKPPSNGAQQGARRLVGLFHPTRWRAWPFGRAHILLTGEYR